MTPYCLLHSVHPPKIDTNSLSNLHVFIYIQREDSRNENRRRPQFGPADSILRSILQMSMVDCEEADSAMRSEGEEDEEDFTKRADACREEKSRLLKFVEDGVESHSPKPFPRETFASLF